MNKSLVCLFAYFAIVVTILSQFAGGVSAVIYLPLWAATLLVAARTGIESVRLGRQQLLLILLLCMMGSCACVAMIFTGEQGYFTGFFMLAVKSLLLYFVGWFLSPHFDIAKKEKTILLLYIVAATVYAVWVVATYVPNLSAWANSEQYLFAQKNSFGQIAGIGALCAVYVALNGKFRGRTIVFIAITLCMVVTICLAQCRTAILAFCVGLLALLCLQRRKGTLLFLLAIVVLALAASPTFRMFFTHALFLDKYSGADLNTFSSGRSDLWSTAIGVWIDNLLIGTGSYYVDDFYLNSLANVGIVGTSFMLAIWIPRIVTNVKYAINPAMSGNLYFAQLACALTVFYLVESILEGNPPFGPGASAFLFWLISGLLDGQTQRFKKNEMDEQHD